MTDSKGRHFSGAGAASGANAGAGGAGSAGSAAGNQAGTGGGSPSETMQFVRAAQGGGRGAGGDAPTSLDAQPVATAPAAPKPIERGAHARQAGTRYRAKQAQQAGSGRSQAGASHAAGRGQGTASRAHAAQAGRQVEEEEPRRRRLTLSTVLIIAGLLLILVAGGVLISALRGYQEAQSSYDDLEQYALIDEDGDGFPDVDFEALAAINSDIVGWIYIPGTEINYPVVQTTDNTTYLTKLFDDTSNTSGTIFMDYAGTAPGMVDMQTTIYGHHMNDGSMFKYIDDTLDQEAFDTVEVVYYITADAVYVLKPLCTTEVDENYSNARETNFSSAAVFRSYLRTMISQASAVADDADERVSDCEQVLTLITCAGEVLPRTTRACMLCTIEEVIVQE